MARSDHAEQGSLFRVASEGRLADGTTRAVLDVAPNFGPRRVMSTSRDARTAIEPHVSSQAQRVLDAVRELGGATDAEIHDATGIERSSICARRNELLGRDLHGVVVNPARIRDSGQRRKRDYEQKGPALIVWEIV